MIKIEVAQSTIAVGINSQDTRENVNRFFDQGEIHNVNDDMSNNFILEGCRIGQPDYTYYIPKYKCRVLEVINVK